MNGSNPCPHCGQTHRSTARFCPVTGMSMPVTPPPLPPKRIRSNQVFMGRYRVEKVLSQGRFGGVYLAMDIRLGDKKCALKELSEAALVDPGEIQLARDAFQREARLLSTLSHPNLPRVTDFFPEGGKQYLVMDFVEGTPMDELLENQSFPFNQHQVLHWAEQLCNVLGYLHGHSPPIIFRDLKPSNIMVSADGQTIKLINFGLTRIFKTRHQMATGYIGTSAFEPPEQSQGKTDPRSDIYALGATLHQLLTLRDPHDDPFRYPPVRALNPEISPHVESAIHRALEQDPDQRWPSMRAFSQALRVSTYSPAISVAPDARASVPPTPRQTTIGGPESVPSGPPLKAGTSIITRFLERMSQRRRRSAPLPREKSEPPFSPGISPPEPSISDPKETTTSPEHTGVIHSPGAPTSKTITRFPDVYMREKVLLGQRCSLRVAVTQAPVKEKFSDKGMVIAVPEAEESATIDVLVTAEDFQVIGEECRKLVIPLARDSEPLIFQMVPRSLGAKKIKTEFFQDHKYIGGLTLSTEVVSPEQVPAQTETHMRGEIGLAGKGFPPDLTILITEKEAQGNLMRYTFRLHAPEHGLFFHNIVEELVFTGSPSRWMENLYKELAILALTEDPQNLMETVASIGTDLFEALFPQQLRDIWRDQIRGKVQTIMVISDEPWIPWEIIKPAYDLGEAGYVEDGFLCEDYELTRWIAGPSPPSSITIQEGVVIAPLEQELPNAQREVLFLESFLGARKIRPRLENVRSLLKTGGVQLIHFACHGSFDPELHEQSVLYLEGNERLRSRDISGARRSFGHDKPFVVLNACQSARADFSLVGVGSWAEKFIHSKASGFLGASWEVDDSLARAFSEKFYQSLMEGLSIAQAVKTARSAIKEAGDPAWLAYCVYADPLAKVEFS